MNVKGTKKKNQVGACARRREKGENKEVKQCFWQLWH